ncbi:hypothetical protein [Comamonas aquatilis]|uniref:hypothetical protein n=1 Tax=Comamonas aquatilis TaxID=1778406 RepID=UPI0039EFE781
MPPDFYPDLCRIQSHVDTAQQINRFSLLSTPHLAIQLAMPGRRVDSTLDTSSHYFPALVMKSESSEISTNRQKTSKKMSILEKQLYFDRLTSVYSALGKSKFLRKPFDFKQ